MFFVVAMRVLSPACFSPWPFHWPDVAGIWPPIIMPAIGAAFENRYFIETAAIQLNRDHVGDLSSVRTIGRRPVTVFLLLLSGCFLFRGLCVCMFILINVKGLLTSVTYLLYHEHK